MNKTRITALGDSLTKGVILTEDNRYTVADGCFIDIIGNELDLSVENYGKFGCTVGFGGCVIDRHADKIKESDYTFIEYGGNDCDFDWVKIAQAPDDTHAAKTELEPFKKQFTDLISRVKGLGSVPVIISLPPIIPDVYFPFLSRGMTRSQKNNIIRWLGGDINIISRWHESYNRALFSIAYRTRTHIIDITTPFDIYRGNLRSLYCPDGIHPNAKGHKLIAKTIIDEYL
jgi:lysophospholipase L1-like esterase